MKKRKISDAVVRRLPRYYRYLDDLHSKGIVRISSSLLGERMGITASQIRQDLSCFGEFGQQGYGYNILELRTEIGHILGVDEQHRLVVVGAGHLGHATPRSTSPPRSSARASTTCLSARSTRSATISPCAIPTSRC